MENRNQQYCSISLLVCLITVIFGITPALAGEQLYFYHNDHLGTPQMMTDEDQNVVWEAEYRPFGQVVIVTEEVENNLRFAGQYYDRESNLHYNYFRDYDPSIGRYTEGDPIGLFGGLNTYLYVEGNPINLIDPTGEFAIPQPSESSSQSIDGNESGGSCPTSMSLEERCGALKRSILNTCAGLRGRAKFRCWDSADVQFRQCMGWI